MSTNSYLQLGSVEVLVVRKPIKNLHLSVLPPAGRVRVTSPENMKDDAIRTLIAIRLPWIKRQQGKFAGQERQLPREYKTRESHYYQGKRYLLRVIETETKQRVVLRGKTYIDMFVRKETSKEKRHELMNEWYREQLKKQIPDLLEKWEKKIGVKANDWGVKLMKTKWGSCNVESKRVWLNLELAKKPVQCFEYILMHELVYLKERHHNERFMAYMEKYLPHWKQLKTELNRLPVSHADWKY